MTPRQPALCRGPSHGVIGRALAPHYSKGRSLARSSASLPCVPNTIKLLRLVRIFEQAQLSQEPHYAGCPRCQIG